MSSLESLSRKELQTLAKSHGLKANSSSVELIRDLLVLLDKNEAVIDPIVIEEDKNLNISKEDYLNVNSIIEVLIDNDWQKATVKRVNKKTIRVVVFSNMTELTVNIENTRSMRQTEDCIQEISNLTENEILKFENDTINVDEILNYSSPNLKNHRRRKVKDSFKLNQNNDNLESEPQVNAKCVNETPELIVESLTKIPTIVSNEIPIIDDQNVNHNIDDPNVNQNIDVNHDISTTDVQNEQFTQVIEKVETNLPLSNNSSTKINISNNLLPKNIPRMNNSQRLRMEAIQLKLSMIDSQNHIRSSTPNAFTSNTTTPPLRATITTQLKSSRQSVLSVKKTPTIISASVRQSTSGGCFDSFTGKRKTLEDSSDKSLKYSAPDFKSMHSKQFSGLKSIAECVDKKQNIEIRMNEALDIALRTDSKSENPFNNIITTSNNIVQKKTITSFIENKPNVFKKSKILQDENTPNKVNSFISN